VQPRIHNLLTHSWQSQANLSFFLSLLVMLGFVLPAFGIERRFLPLYADIAFCVLSVAGTAIAWENRRLFVLTSLVAIVAIALRWASWRKPTNTLILWSVSAGLVAIVTIMVVLLWQVFRRGPVTWMRIQGAIAAYLCIGFAWSHAYRIASVLDLGAFTVAGSDASLPTTWVNYSFGMLTTVGYQGILPAHPVAHSLGSGEAVTGQLYLTVLVARLVSMQVSAVRKGPDESSTPRSSA
jgi:hypothetical protein